MIEHKLYNFELIVFSRTNEGGSRSNVVVLMVPNRAAIGILIWELTCAPPFWLVPARSVDDKSVIRKLAALAFATGPLFRQRGYSATDSV